MNRSHLRIKPQKKRYKMREVEGAAEARLLKPKKSGWVKYKISPLRPHPMKWLVMSVPNSLSRPTASHKTKTRSKDQASQTFHSSNLLSNLLSSTTIFMKQQRVSLTKMLKVWTRKDNQRKSPIIKSTSTWRTHSAIA